MSEALMAMFLLVWPTACILALVVNALYQRPGITKAKRRVNY